MTKITNSKLRVLQAREVVWGCLGFSKMHYYTECVRPEGIEPELFVDREQEREDLKLRISNALRTKRIEGIRFLGTGERGIGKSILREKYFF